MLILPDVSRFPTARAKIADFVFIMLLLCARFCFLIGAVIGATVHGFLGFLVGLGAGLSIGFLMRRSLGVSGRNLTQAYHFRMHERGLGKHPRILESLVEVLRGNRPTMMQCRQIASAFAEAARELQSCDSLTERAVIMAKRDRQVQRILYGESPSPYRRLPVK